MFRILTSFFFASSVCKSFRVSSMTGSVFHVILLLYNFHFGSNSQNQEITGKTHQTDLVLDNVFFYKMSKVCIVLFQTMQNNNDVVTFLTLYSTKMGLHQLGPKIKSCQKS